MKKNNYLFILILLCTQAHASNLNQFFSGGASSGNKTLKVQEFTTAGTHTWTKPAGVDLVTVECWGGGGGGASGGCYSTCGTAYVRGGPGGGSGVYAKKENIPVTGNVTVTIGAGGAGGASVKNTSIAVGGTGVASSFGSFLIANGGNGGTGTAAGGSDLVGVNYVTASGGAAGIYNEQSTACYTGTGGSRGSSPALGGAGVGGNGGTTPASCCNFTSSGLRYVQGVGGGGGAGGKGAGGVGGNGHANTPTAGTPGGVGAGGGGGGGCAGSASGSSGAGGDGGIGYCAVSWWE